MSNACNKISQCFPHIRLLNYQKFSTVHTFCRSIFQDMVSMDMLVIKIMNYAQRLVNADRASLFLIDSKAKELYATIFDVGFDDDIQEKMNSPRGAKETTDKMKSDEIRFPLGTGIAGQCALSGEVFNIVDAYSDERFNRNIDQLTGYKTETILCMPIFIRGSLIGVVEMVNKRVGAGFTKEDEEAFETFAMYCGLALHHAKLYDKIRRSEKKYRVALEVLSYHNGCTDDEIQRCEALGIPESLPKLSDYTFSPFEIDDFKKVTYVIYMFKDMFGFNRFDQKNLMRFVLTVKKNYRRVPYHNWTHGFSVANSMYAIIKNSKALFRPNEVSRESSLVSWYNFLVSSVCRCSLARSVTTWTTVAKAISSCSTRHRPSQRFTPLQPWNTTTSTRP